jgi:hypothetical protein
MKTKPAPPPRAVRSQLGLYQELEQYLAERRSCEDLRALTQVVREMEASRHKGTPNSTHSESC